MQEGSAEDQMSLYIISDCHGNYDGLMRALRDKKIVDKNGNRQLARKNKIFSIGDLANCVADSKAGDKACLDLVGPVIDGMVLGNHEVPYFDPANMFNGFWAYESVAKRLNNLMDNGLIHGSILKDRTLITHAGVSKSLLSYNMTVIEVHGNISEHFEARNWNASWFASIGYARGGRNHCGGTLWCDFEREFRNTKFPQIVGHTPKYVRMKGNAICIDVGAKDQETEPFILEVS